ncbi:MAG TPA: hypothetical protein VNO30_36765 [Kofleriaceae bacterium]|nr:hypothetical protein [Kofleriaceae bacterium]
MQSVRVRIIGGLAHDGAAVALDGPRPVTADSPGGPMSSRHELHAYDYVNHPYETVRDLLLASPLTVFRHATTAVALRNEATGAELHAKAGPLDIRQGLRPIQW